MELRILVGAATSAQFDQVFRSLPAVAAAANKKITDDAKAAAAVQNELLKARLAKEKASFAELLRETGKVHDQTRKIEAASHETRLKLREEAAKKATAIEVGEATARAKAIGAIEVAQAKQAMRQTRAALGGSGGGGGGGGRDMAYRMGYWGSRNLSPVTPMLSFAGRMANDVVRGTGVDFNVSSMVAQQFELQKRTVALSNQGYQDGQPGAAGQRVLPATLEGDVRAVGKQFGFAYDEVAAAMTKFVDVSGNLEQARATMGDLARLSNATGTELHDMASAAAAVAVQLDRAMGPDSQAKAQAQQNIMRTFAGQGKLGAVEMKDLAVQMAKIAVVAPRFAGNIQDVFTDVGVLAQESRKAGGSASAAQSATSIARLSDLLINPKTQKAFTRQMAAAGMAPESLFADKGQTKLRPVEEIVLTALEATKGSLPKLQGLFKNVMANRSVEGFAGVYNATQGTEKEKLAAVHSEFESLRKAALTETREREDNARVMETAAKKAQVFQDRLQDVVSELATKAIPQFERLAPAALDVMSGFTKMTGWLAENPLAIVPVALGAAIAKAGVEQSIRVGIENLIRNPKGGSAFMGVQSGGLGAAGTAAAAFTITSMAVTTFTAGKLYIDDVLSKKDAAQKGSIEADLNAGNVESTLTQQLKSGKVDPAMIAKAQEAAKGVEDSISKEKSASTPYFDRFMKSLGYGDDVRKVEHMRDERMHALTEDLVRLTKKIADGVKITNLPPGGLLPGASGTTNTGAARP